MVLGLLREKENKVIGDSKPQKLKLKRHFCMSY